MIVIVGLILAFILILVFSNRETRHCRWRAQGWQDGGRGRAFRCMTCGAEAFTSEGKPPLHCMAMTPRR